MTDLLVRDLSAQAARNLTAQATAAGLSRNEYVRRALEQMAVPEPERKVTSEDMARFHASFADLADAQVMQGAWT